jgi:lysophospholipase L1-like esterase
VASTLKAAVLFAAGQTAAGTAAPVLLANGAMRTAALNKLLVLVCLLAAGAVATVGGLLALQAQTKAPRNAMPAAAGKGGGPALSPRGKGAARAVHPRIVFVGDSSTDGYTYLLLIRQALAREGRPVPTCINAGISTDTARGVRDRLERDVFVHRPTLVAFSAGVHDALYNVAPADYEANVRTIAARLRSKGVPLLLLTTGLLGGPLAKAEPRLAEYNAILHRLAGELGCRVADVNRRLREARASGQVVVEGDNVNPNYQGQRLIARAVLDALGHDTVAVPRELSLSPMPGILKEWRVRIAPAGQTALNERLVTELDTDSPGWAAYTLPEKGPAPTWWLEQERKRGFALSLDKRLGAAKVYQGVSSLRVDRPKTVFLHTGAHLQSVWLNGRRVYRSDGWTGWHAGKERVPVRLRAGRNVMVIDCGPNFFLSVTDHPETPEG